MFDVSASARARDDPVHSHASTYYLAAVCTLLSVASTSMLALVLALCSSILFERHLRNVVRLGRTDSVYEIDWNSAA